MTNRKPRILIWDIESSHLLALTFGLFKQNILHSNVLIDKHLYCICYKWYGEKKIHTISILDDKKRFKKDIHDDRSVITEFRKVIEQADAHVAHYGDGFDLPMFNERLICHGLKPIPDDIVSLDTKKIASRHFRFTSNKLDFLAKKLGHIGKIVNNTDLWLNCFKGDEKALKRMAYYCRGDISALEYIFVRLMPFVKNNPLNYNLFKSDAHETLYCTNPLCGSTNLKYKRDRKTTVNIYKRYQCDDCGKWCTERTALRRKPRKKMVVATRVR